MFFLCTYALSRIGCHWLVVVILYHQKKLTVWALYPYMTTNCTCTVCEIALFLAHGSARNPMPFFKVPTFRTPTVCISEICHIIFTLTFFASFDNIQLVYYYIYLSIRTC